MHKKSRANLLSLRRVRAFTLIEVLIALAITVIALVPLLHLLTTSILMNDSAWNLSQATQIGNARLAELISRTDLAIGTDEGSVESLTKETVFQWRSEVSEVSIEELEETNLAELRKVTVTVSWDEGQNRRQISFTTYVVEDTSITTVSAI
jgi:prepilin-type N-terminal cleavage/methylation domain-containing protein